MSKNVHCENCGTEITLTWVACSNCGTTISEDMVNCVRCYHLIPSKGKFCTFCSADQGDKTIIREEPVIKPKTKKRISYEVHDGIVDRKTLTASLRFDTNATSTIVSSERFTNRSYFLIMGSGMFFALTLIVMGALFGEEQSFKETVKFFIEISMIQISVLFWAAFISRLQFNSLELRSEYNMNFRYFGIWGFTSIIRDIFMYPAMIYVLIFEGESGLDLVIIIYITFTLLVITFLVIHGIVYYRNVTGYGFIMNLMLFLMTSLLTWLLTIYNMELVNVLIDSI